MSIQKKSLISTLKTAKKANVASQNTNDGEAKGAKVSSMRVVSTRNATPRAISGTTTKRLKATTKTVYKQI